MPDTTMLIRWSSLVFAIQQAIGQQCHYRKEFQLKFYGQLSVDDHQTIFTANGTSFGNTMHKCINFCSDDQRCIGIELCKMNDGLFNCRVCCEWKKLGNRVEAQPGCKYMEKNNENAENLAETGELSTIFGDDQQFNGQKAVDGITACDQKIGTIAHTKSERAPWLRIGLKKKVAVSEVLLYNRLILGDRLHDVSVNVTGDGMNYPCGFYPGPGVNGDRTLFLCKGGAIGDTVIITIQAKERETEYLQLCEVEVFSRP